MKSLDYTKGGCANFRDVGECLTLLAGREVLPSGRLLRGGKLEFVERPEQIGQPGSVVNLRKGDDPPDRLFGADYWHIAVSNDHEKYDTTDPVVRRWLNDVLHCVAADVTRWPVLFHCTSGKDRTGVAVAAVLACLGVDRELIVDEYLWSEGEVQREWIVGSLDGIGDPEAYFRRVDLSALRRKLLEPITSARA